MHTTFDSLKLSPTAIFLLAFLILGAGVSPAHGQVDIEPGVKGALNLADLRGDDAQFLLQDEQDPSRRTGVAVGGFAQVNLDETFGLRPELAYVQKGASAETEVQPPGGQTQTVEATLRIDYIELPVLGTVALREEGDVRPVLFAGPALAFNVSAEQELEADGETETADFSDAISDVDVGLHLGAGADVPTGAGTVTLDARYELGVLDLPDEGDADIQNQGIRFSVGLIF